MPENTWGVVGGRWWGERGVQGGASKLFPDSHKISLIPFRRAQDFNPNDLSKASSPNIITFRARVSTYGFGGDTNIQLITVPIEAPSWTPISYLHSTQAAFTP